MKKYKYPNGKDMEKKPSNGQLCILKESHNGQINSIWSWDNSSEEWIDVTYKMLSKVEGAASDEQQSFTICDCGAEKSLVFKNHSYWCKKFIPCDV